MEKIRINGDIYFLFEGCAGQHIDSAIKEAIEKAKICSEKYNKFITVLLVFNGVLLPVTMCSNASEVSKLWMSELNRHQDEYQKSDFYRAAEAKHKWEIECTQNEVDTLIDGLKGHYVEEFLDYLRIHKRISYIEARYFLNILVKLIPRLDHVGVTYDRDFMYDCMDAMGFNRGECCGGDVEEYGKNLELALRWFFGQIMDQICTVGCPHPALTSHGEKLIERIDAALATRKPVKTNFFEAFKCESKIRGRRNG